ncbi:MAG: hypothetical protein ACOY3N_04770, partial [Bradyrhizobium sp.]|uniref:hypothetical protein n=1 Tax=Bradyrhizobium sp. TaxID=376 RepID=UPI003BF26B7A
VRIPIKATAREPIRQAGYISATSETYARSLLRNAAGPYIRVNRVDLPLLGRVRFAIASRQMEERRIVSILGQKEK